MRKLNFLKTMLLLCALIVGNASAWADEAVIYYDGTSANSITVNGFTIAITGNSDKKWSAGNGDITYGGTKYKTLKNSNGAQNTVTCPSGKVATQVKFIVTSNKDASGYLTEIDGTSCNDEVTSQKDYDSPTTITKDLDSKSSFTFTFSTNQVCFIAVVTYTDAAADVVANPVFTQTDNSVEISCATTGAKIYYTIDGSEPTPSSNLYSSAIVLTNPCTIRAKAFNGESNEYSSDEVKRDCFFNHDTALYLIGWDEGSMNSGNTLWTSSDNHITLKNNAVGGVLDQAVGFTHGFKLSHTTTYTIQPSSDVKVTKIAVVGQTWLASSTATIAIDGCTPAEAQSFFATDESRNTYVKTIEFTPSTVDYGQTIVVTIAGSQLGAYFEIFGEKRKGPDDPQPVGGDAITWDFSSADAQTAALHGATFSTSESNTLYATDGSTTIVYKPGESDALTKSGSTYYLKANGKTNNNTRYFILPISCSGKLSLTTTSNNGKFTILKAANSTTTWNDATDLTTITTSADGVAVEGNIVYDADKPYIYIGFPDAKLYTQKIVWTPASDDITLTTTANMAGYRAFYDADQGYTVKDASATVFIATAKDASTITLTSIDDIPAATPVILKAASSADSYKMTLTKAATTSSDATGNLLSVTTAGQNLSTGNIYRLGYSEADGTGFYPWNPVSAEAGIVYINTDSSARMLSITFDETTGINAVEAQKQNSNEFYNLAGQRVAQPTKGLYIVNGKKVIIK